MVYKNVHLPISLLRSRQLENESMSLDFSIPIGFEYEAGDWIDIALDEQLRGGITYSLSSSPTEPELSITFKKTSVLSSANWSK